MVNLGLLWCFCLGWYAPVFFWKTKRIHNLYSEDNFKNNKTKKFTNATNQTKWGWFILLTSSEDGCQYDLKILKILKMFFYLYFFLFLVSAISPENITTQFNSTLLLTLKKENNLISVYLNPAPGDRACFSHRNPFLRPIGIFDGSFCKPSLK